MTHSPSQMTMEQQRAELRGIVRIIPFALLEPFVSALALLSMWRWFVVPLGVINISYWHCLGLTILFIFLKSSVGTSDGGQDTAAYWANRYKMTFIKLPIYLLSAWIIHLLMRSA